MDTFEPDPQYAHHPFPVYRLLSKAFIAPWLVEAGSVIRFDGPPRQPPGQPADGTPQPAGLRQAGGVVTLSKTTPSTRRGKERHDDDRKPIIRSNSRFRPVPYEGPEDHSFALLAAPPPPSSEPVGLAGAALMQATEAGRPPPDPMTVRAPKGAAIEGGAILEAAPPVKKGSSLSQPNQHS